MSTDLAVVAESMPPGTAEIAHRHERANQFFFVLSGELTIVFDHEEVRVKAQSGISVPAGAVHQARNDGRVSVTFLAIAGPSNVGDRIDQAR